MKDNIRDFMNKKLIAFSLVILLFGSYSNVFAVAANAEIRAIHEQIDPARFPVQDEETLLPQSTTTRISVPITPETKLPDAEKVTFKLKQIKVRGSDILAKEQVTAVYQPYLNKKVSVATLQKIVQQITVLYRNEGYVLTQAVLPPQEIDSGIVSIQIIEGYISNSSIEGECNTLTKWILNKYGQHVTKQRPLHIDMLERYALLANELPGIKVRTVLRASKTRKGAADLVFVVDRNRTSESLVIDNRGTRLLGPFRYILSLQVNETMPGGKTGVRILRSGDFKEVVYHEFFHQQQINPYGLTWNIDYGQTSSKPDLSEQGIDGLSSNGASSKFSTSIAYPIIRTRKQNLKMSVGFKASKSKSTTGGVQNFHDKIRSVKTEILFDRADRFGASILAVNYQKGLDIFGASNKDPSRGPTFSKTFNKFEGTLTRYQRIYGPVALLLSAKGQYSLDRLPSLEEFGVGGGVFGLAYDSSEITGDHGLSWKAELQVSIPVRHFKFFINPPKLFIYADGGRIWNINSSQSEAADRLASAGGGMKMKITKYVDFSFVAAKPLNKKQAIAQNREARLFFSLVASV